MINLVQHARGLREGWYSAQILDDQPETISAERDELNNCKITDDLQERAQEFLLSLMHWMHERKRVTVAERAETRRVLVIDVNLPNLRDVRSIAAVRGVTIEAGVETKTTGTNAGLVLIDVVLRSAPRFSKLPIVVLSGYGMDGSEARWDRIKRKPGAPVHFIKKSVLTGSGPEEFKQTVGELLHDERLLFVEKVANFWGLQEGQVCGMLGVRKPNLALIAQLFDRGTNYPNEDADQRVRLLLTIHESLYRLMRDQDQVRGWLNAKSNQLNSQRPIDLITSCDFEKLAVVKHSVDFLCMR